MLTLYGFRTQNTMKTLYVIEELNCDYDFVFVDLFKGEQKTEAFSELTPIGKVPVLRVEDNSIFESGTICRYLADSHGPHLYPADPFSRAQTDQWLDFFSCHLGRWINALYFQNIIKPRVGLGDPDPEACEEAKNFMGEQLSIINNQLGSNECLAGDDLSIADFFAFAYIEQTGPLEFSLEDYPHVEKWLAKLEAREAITRARQKIPN